jgi:mono/diheme cytochrome c family protein
MNRIWRMLPLFLVAAAGCAGRRSEPLVGPIALTTTKEQNGHKVFLEQCEQCHPGGEAGLGPGLNAKPAPEVAIKLQVRKGLGDMPAFNDQKISDADLDDIVAYMMALRRGGR